MMACVLCGQWYTVACNAPGHVCWILQLPSHLAAPLHQHSRSFAPSMLQCFVIQTAMNHNHAAYMYHSRTLLALLLQVFDCSSMMQQQQPQEYVLPWPSKPSGTALEASRDPMRRRLQPLRAASPGVSAAHCSAAVGHIVQGGVSCVQLGTRQSCAVVSHMLLQLQPQCTGRPWLNAFAEVLQYLRSVAHKLVCFVASLEDFSCLL